MADAVALCEPAELYNILTEVTFRIHLQAVVSIFYAQDAVVPALTDKTRLLLIG